MNALPFYRLGKQLKYPKGPSCVGKLCRTPSGTLCLFDTRFLMWGEGLAAIFAGTVPVIEGLPNVDAVIASFPDVSACADIPNIDLPVAFRTKESGELFDRSSSIGTWTLNDNDDVLGAEHEIALTGRYLRILQRCGFTSFRWVTNDRPAIFQHPKLDLRACLMPSVLRGAR